MNKVYWTEVIICSQTGQLVQSLKSAQFESHQLKEALQFCEGQRAVQRNLDPGSLGYVSFIVMASENPNSVGRQGSSEPATDYNWRKRRADPQTFGRLIPRK